MTSAENFPSLELTPSGGLDFEWTKESDIPKAKLEAMNNSAKHIIYKVKTTKPKRYVVRPPQGVILPGEKAEIFLTMVPADALKLWNDAVNQSRSGGDLLRADDKFLVQMAHVTEEFYLKELSGKDEKTQGTVLQALWKKLTEEERALEKSKKPKQTKNSKLTTTFVFPDFPVYLATRPDADPIDPTDDTAGAQQFAELKKRGSSAQPDSSVAASSAQSSDDPNVMSSNNDDAIFSDLAMLRKKYDDLVAYTVVLTGERDFFQKECDQREGELKKQQDENRKLRKSGASGAASGSGSGAAGGAGATKGSEIAGFNFVHVVVVGLVAFIVGRIIS